MTTRVQAERAYYLKLGSAGAWERECLTEKQTLRIGFREIGHDACAAGQWQDVKRQARRLRGNKGQAEADTTELRRFYTADQDALWITFHAGTLWWCKAQPEVTAYDDGTRIRKVAGRWRNDDVNGQPLSEDRLKGSLVAIRGFRRTICEVKDFDYLLNKINAVAPPDAVAARDARTVLEARLTDLITRLHPNDFELLVDLMFREAGWKRVGQLGRNVKDVDLELVSDLTREKAFVQVKSRATRATFNEYQERFSQRGDYAKGFFVVHSADKVLAAMPDTDEQFRFLGPEALARLCVDYGLTSWLIAEAE